MKLEAKWNSRHAWPCALAMVVLAEVMNRALQMAAHISISFAHWWIAHPNFIQGFLLISRSMLWLLFCFGFARVRSIRVFIQDTGLGQRPGLLGWSVAWIGVGIGLIAIYGTWTGRIPPNRLSRSFFYAGWASQVFFVAYAVLLGPFAEELAMRGFLYRAFRGSYGTVLSTTLVLCVHLYFHWGLLSRSLYTLACIESLEIVLCALRERKENTWNCVLCHAAYNAVQNSYWQIWLVGIFLLLPYCLSRTRQPLDKAPHE